MEVSLSEIKVVCIRGIKAQIKLFPEDVAEVGGVSYIRLKPYCRKLIRVVVEHNDLAPENKSNMSLSTSIGMQLMLSLIHI